MVQSFTEDTNKEINLLEKNEEIKILLLKE